MTTVTHIHDATNIKTRGVSHNNDNAISLDIETDGHWGTLSHTVTIFGLPTHIADALEELLGNGGVEK